VESRTGSKVLILPGLYNSGPNHWQSCWEKLFPQLKRVNQADWETPSCDDWIEVLNNEILLAGNDVVLVAHSLACTLITKWSEKYPTAIRGALLVAPSDTEADTYPKGTHGFTPMTTKKLPFLSTVIASSNDPYVALERAKYFANVWGSELIIAGDLGHIGSDSNLGAWPIGLEQLAKISGDKIFLKETLASQHDSGLHNFSKKSY